MSAQEPDPATLQHFSLYGPKCIPSTRRILASEWETKPFSQPVSSPWRATIPGPSLANLINGYCPSVMEEKWFVYSDGPDQNGLCAVHMHRSWGGEKMFEVRLRMGGMGQEGEVTEIVWESDPDLLRWSSEEFAKSTAKEVCAWVLGVTVDVQE
jgi:hypothetical protein